MDTLRVRMYNVHTGDAILLTVPERAGDETVTRHILIDMGNLRGPRQPREDDRLFRPVLDDVLAQLDGRPLDLYILSHEHMDHCRGLCYAAEKLYAQGELGARLQVQHAWFPASSQPGYLATHVTARQRLDQAQAFLKQMRALAGRSPVLDVDWVHALLANNDTAALRACLRAIRGPHGLLGDTEPVYLSRGADTDAAQPFTEARFSIWAPEEDSARYYAPLQAVPGGEAAGADPVMPLPPPGVDAGAFYNLLAYRLRVYTDNLLALSNATNDTSLAVCIEWRGWRLLFPGDAQAQSWREMAKAEQLRPVHFLKVSDHGSAGGAPPADLLDRLLPAAPAGAHPHTWEGRRRVAAVSAGGGPYPNTPDEATLGALAARCELYNTARVPAGGWIDVKFEAEG